MSRFEKLLDDPNSFDETAHGEYTELPQAEA